MTAQQRIEIADYGFGASFEDRFIPPAPNQNCFWIILEGEDGVGKTTLANALKHALSVDGKRCVVEAFGKHFIPSDDLQNETRWLRFMSEFAVRMPYLQDLVEDGWSIIQDRGFPSTLVYQQGEWEKTAFVIDALFYQWNEAPSHIFILPPYGEYIMFRDIKRLFLPLSGKTVYLVLVPPEVETLTERVEFVLSVLTEGIRFVEEEDATNSTETDEGGVGDDDQVR